MDSDLGPTVIAGSDASVVGDLARLVPAASTVVTVVPEQPAAPAAAVLVGGTEDGWDQAAAEVERTWGIPRMVVIAPAPVARTGLADLAGPDWSSALDRNLGTAAAACRAFAPGLARRPAVLRPLASIVLVTWRNAAGPGAVHLAAVAGAVRLFALALAADLGPSGITVNAVTVPEDDLAAAGPAVELLSSPDAGYLTAEVLTPRSGPGGWR
jgi:NAD(P)-dependent dehydrogenase (short-subunit alcohol dehydrogenase family)